MDTPKHSVSVSAIITDDHDRALLIKRLDNGHWEPPGGVLELGETIKDGLRREVREETGLDIDVGPLTGVYKNMTRGVIALVFAATIRGGCLVATDETADFRWEDERGVRELANEAYAIRVLDALTSNPRASVREHNGFQVLPLRY
jgi:8-oxo-dGTP diphosphatase